MRYECIEIFSDMLTLVHYMDLIFAFFHYTRRMTFSKDTLCLSPVRKDKLYQDKW